jgi:aldehyde dehydrogenase (NAD+)
MIVPRARLARVEELAAAAAAGFVTGDPTDPAVTLGPVVSAAQHRRVQDYIRAGLDEGARLITGGPGLPDGLDRGYYVKPTVFSGVAPSMVIAQEEIFGPVLVMLPYDSTDEAVEIANSTIYGLAAAVWSADTASALDVARRLRAGQVEINEGAFDPMAPFGGCKQSGRHPHTDHPAHVRA